MTIRKLNRSPEALASARSILLGYLKEGSAVYTVVRAASYRSTPTKWISLFVIDTSGSAPILAPITAYAAKALNRSVEDFDMSIRCKGGNTNLENDLVSDLSYALFGREGALRQMTV